MSDAIPEEEKSRRLRILQERQRAIQTVRNEALVGSVTEVFVDIATRRENQWAGRTSSNRMVNVTSPRESLLGEYVHVRITASGSNSLTGEHLISA
jgi:tRNA-2-methylthio-N6-dimethylallyladenosine synthase